MMFFQLVVGFYQFYYLIPAPDTHNTFQMLMYVLIECNVDTYDKKMEPAAMILLNNICEF